MKNNMIAARQPFLYDFEIMNELFHGQLLYLWFGLF